MADEKTIFSIVGLFTGIGVAVLILIFIGVMGGQTYNLVEEKINVIGNKVVTGGSFNATNATPVFLGNYDIHVGSLVIWNDTAKPVTITENFTIDYGLGTASLNDAEYNDTTVHTNYTWGRKEIQTSIKDSIVSSFDALNQTGDYLPIIILAIIITIVLSLLLGSTALGGGSNRGSQAL